MTQHENRFGGQGGEPSAPATPDASLGDERDTSTTEQEAEREPERELELEDELEDGGAGQAASTDADEYRKALNVARAAGQELLEKLGPGNAVSELDGSLSSLDRAIAGANRHVTVRREKLEAEAAS